MSRYKIPYLKGAYRQIYTPMPDVYKGLTTKSFKSGKKYNEWIVNDFSIIKDDVWHIVGITHPKPTDFIDDFNCSKATVHEAEYQLFHCTSLGETFSDVIHGDVDGTTYLLSVFYPNNGISAVELGWK